MIGGFPFGILKGGSDQTSVQSTEGQYETKDILSYQGLPFFLCFIFITQIDGANVTNVPLRVAFDKIKEADRRVRLHIKKADTSEVCLH